MNSLVQEHLFELFDNETEGVLIAEFNTQKFINANKGICNMLGYS